MNKSNNEQMQFLDLDNDIIHLIFEKLNMLDKLRFKQVNREIYYNKDFKTLPKFLSNMSGYYIDIIKNPDFTYKDGILNFDNSSFPIDDLNDLYFYKVYFRNIIITSDKFIFQTNSGYITKKFESNIEYILTLFFYHFLIIKTKDYFYFFYEGNIYEIKYSDVKKKKNIYFLKFKIDSTSFKISIYQNKNICEIVSYLKETSHRNGKESFLNSKISKFDRIPMFTDPDLELISDDMDDYYRTQYYQ